MVIIQQLRCVSGIAGLYLITDARWMTIHKKSDKAHGVQQWGGEIVGYKRIGGNIT